MQISIYLPPRLLALVDLHAKRRSVSRSALIAEAMRELVGDAKEPRATDDRERDPAR